MARRGSNFRDNTVGSYFSTDAGGFAGPGGSLGQTPGVPPVNIPGFQDFFGTAQGLQIPSLGLFTPWGRQVPTASQFGYTFEPLGAPVETNLVIFGMAEVEQLLRSLGFGAPGFVAIFSETPLQPESVRRNLEGTQYAFFGEGLALYNQADLTPMPKAYFLYWANLRDPGDPSGGSASVSQAAASLGAELVFAQQVPVEPTKMRTPPGDVTTAVETQFPSIFRPPEPAPAPPGPMPEPGGPEEPPGPPPGPVPEPTPGAASMFAPVLVGVGAAALGFFVARGTGGTPRRRKRKRGRR